MKKNQIILILGLILAIAGLVFLQIKAFQQKKPFIIDQNQIAAPRFNTTLNQAVYTGPDKVFPGTLPILQLSVQDNQSLLIENAKKFCQVSEDQTIEEETFYGKICNFYKSDQNQIQISPAETLSSVTGDISLPNSLVSASEIMNHFYPIGSISPLQNSIEYFQGEYELILASPNQANHIQIPFAFTYANIPIFSHNLSNYPMSVLLDNQNHFSRIYLDSLSYGHPETLAKNRDLLNLNQAVVNINQNQAYLLNFYSPNDATLAETGYDIKNLTQIKLTDASLEYRPTLDYQNNLGQYVVIPVYNFSGSAVDSSGNFLIVNIITPAVNLEIIN